jgi:hypothetical protein
MNYMVEDNDLHKDAIWKEIMNWHNPKGHDEELPGRSMSENSDGKGTVM